MIPWHMSQILITRKGLLKTGEERKKLNAGGVAIRILFILKMFKMNNVMLQIQVLSVCGIWGFTASLVRIQFFWDVRLCLWVSGSLSFEGRLRYLCQGQAVAGPLKC
jgi:hypothetical protein